MRSDLKNAIFLSYRRKDTASAAGRLHDYLEKEFDADMVFKDIHDIGLGTDFRKEIGKTLMNCKVVLVLIGDRYVSLTDAEGNIRIMNPDDYVNIEVSTALAFKDQKLVIPILINGARMPGRDQIPKNLEAITWQNSKKLSNDYWQTDIERLVKSIREYLHLPKEEKRSIAPPIRKTVQKTIAASPPKSNNSGIFKGIALGVLGLVALLVGIGIAFSPEDTIPTETHAHHNFSSFMGYVDATQLNVRSEPGTAGTDIITRLEQGDLVSVLNEKYHDGKSWYQINVDEHEGWVSGDYISKSVVSKILQEEQVELSKNQQPTRPEFQQQNPTPSKIERQPVTSYSYQQLAVGSWKLQRLSYDGESLTLEDFMTVLTEGALFVQSAQLAYYMNGSTNTITSSINGTAMETVTYNYQINGTTFTMSNGTVANIDLLTQQQMNITVNSFDGFTNGQLTFYFNRI